MKWVRSVDGIFAGVCAGLGKRFGVDPWLLRVFWLGSILVFGSGLFLYIIAAVALPREDRQSQALDKRFLGVCGRIASNSGLEVGLVRAAAILLALASFGATIVGYFVLYFVLESRQKERGSNISVI